MALSSTIYHLRIALSDVDRSVYQDLDLRIARHPSETLEYLITRTLAFCLCHEEGIEMGVGLSDSDEPAIFVNDLQGSRKVWIDIGTPSADRMHRASKACDQVVIFTHHDPQFLVKESEKRAIYHRDQIEVYAVDPKMLKALCELTDRNSRWELTRSDGDLYVKIGTKTIEGRLQKIQFAPT